MKARTIEEMLNDQIAACLAATQDCLAHSRVIREDDPDGQLRRLDLDHVARLVKANGRLALALARLKGDTTHSIRVTHGGRKPGRKAEGV